jgi:putative Holliday junction resolvase
MKSDGENGPGRILAIDYGTRRLGLAVSDELWLTAAPLATLTRKNRRDDLKRLRQIVRKHQITRVVLGLPLHLDGSAGELASQAAQFARRMAKELKLPVILSDERLSSWEAGLAVAESRGPGRSGRAMDAVAAAVILRDYLERTAKTR